MFSFLLEGWRKPYPPVQTFSTQKGRVPKNVKMWYLKHYIYLQLYPICCYQFKTFFSWWSHCIPQTSNLHICKQYRFSSLIKISKRGPQMCFRGGGVSGVWSNTTLLHFFGTLPIDKLIVVTNLKLTLAKNYPKPQKMFAHFLAILFDFLPFFLIFFLLILLYHLIGLVKGFPKRYHTW